MKHKHVWKFGWFERRVCELSLIGIFHWDVNGRLCADFAQWGVF